MHCYDTKEILRFGIIVLQSLWNRWNCWPAHRQNCCRGARQISEWCGNFDTSSGFLTSRGIPSYSLEKIGIAGWVLLVELYDFRYHIYKLSHTAAYCVTAINMMWIWMANPFNTSVRDTKKDSTLNQYLFDVCTYDLMGDSKFEVSRNLIGHFEWWHEIIDSHRNLVANTAELIAL